MSATARRVGSVPRANFALRTATALAMALLSLPLLSPPAFAEGEEPAPADLTTQTTTEETTSEPPGEPEAKSEPEAVPPPEDTGTSDEGETTTDPDPDPEVVEEPQEENAPDSTAPGALSDGTSVEVEGSQQILKASDPVIQLDPADANCSVVTFQQNTQENGGGSWINGALNANNSDYAEGDFVPQRVELKGLAPGTYTIQFTYDRTKNGLYAYDFVDHLYISGSAGASISWDAFTGPAPAPFAVTVLVTVEFTIVDGSDETATIGWDGHISSELDYGPNSSAGSINGAPYHFSLVSTDGQFGCDTGARDNQLMASAVDFGTITVVKDAQPNDPQDFHFSLAAPNNLGTSFDLDDDADATLSNTASFHVPPGETTVTEENIPAGWTLTDISCTKPGVEVGSSVTVTLADDELVTCTFTNSRESSLVVDKYWVINGGAPVPDGNQNPVLELDASLTVDGNPEVFGDELDGYLQGGSVSIDEDVTFGNPLCDWADPLVEGAVTEDNGGTPADGSLPYDAMLDEVDNHVTITNTVWCDSELILTKNVENPNGGTAEAADFTLYATPQGGGATLESTGSESGEAFLVDPSETFDLHEDGPSGYTLTSLLCGNAATTSVQVPIGTSVECVFTNTDSPGSLTLDKEALDNNTGDETPDSAWEVSATPINIADQATISGDGFATGGTKAGSYQLAEDGPDTYTEQGWSCTDNETDAVVPVNGDDQVALAGGQHVTCVVTNLAIRPSLTLIKHVDPGDTGDQTGEEAFTLTAEPQDIDGQAVLSGPGPEVSANVRVGTYALSETGPDTYVADDEGWTCTIDGGDSFDPEGDMVEVAVGQDVVCEITNNAVPSSWMVEKSSNPTSGSTVSPTEEIDYTITVTKVGDGVDVLDIEVTDTLTGVEMAWISDIDADAGSVLEGDGVLTWSIPVLGDTPLQLTYTVTVGADAWDSVLHNVVTPGPTPCIDPDPEDAFLECDETTHFTPHFTLDKDVVLLAAPGDDDGLAEPGEHLSYTLTMTNDTEHALLEDAVVTDDLSDVLDDASMVTTPAELAAQGLELSGTTLTWTVAELAPGATVEVTYVVEIDDGAWGVTLRNIATPTPDGPGECIEPGECETTTDTPEVTTMVVEKQDLETGEVLAGATFQLYLDANNALDENGDCTFASPPVVDGDDELLGTVVTGIDGQALFGELQHGCFLLVETAPPPGYELPEVNVMGIQIDELNFVGGGEMAAIVVTDFAEGLLAIVAKRQFELIDGDWVESDGIVGFGDTVRYEVRVSATGPKNFHNVLVTDYVPGFNPDDTTSTVEGSLVPGSAACEGTLTCNVSFDEATQLVTWDIGDVEPPLGETLSTVAVMEVVFPDLPANLDLEPGESFEATLWNVGYLSWSEVSGIAPAARAAGGGLGQVANLAMVEFTFIDHLLTSNEVVVTAKVTARPRPPGKDPDPKPTPPLPDTGAAAGLGLMAGIGALLVALGAMLTRRRRSPGELVRE